MDRVIRNPATGEAFTVLISPEQSGGELAKIDLSVEPNGFVTAEHVHPKQEERFRVVAGTIHLRINGADRYVHSGEEAVVPPGARHVWWNDSPDTPARAIVEVRPALKFLGFLESWFALAATGKLVNNRPVPLQFAVFADEYKDTVTAARPIEKALGLLLLLLAPLGRRLGYKGFIPYPDAPAASVLPATEPAGAGD